MPLRVHFSISVRVCFSEFPYVCVRISLHILKRTNVYVNTFLAQASTPSSASIPWIYACVRNLPSVKNASVTRKCPSPFSGPVGLSALCRSQRIMRGSRSINDRMQRLFVVRQMLLAWWLRCSPSRHISDRSGEAATWPRSCGGGGGGLAVKRLRRGGYGGGMIQIRTKQCGLKQFKYDTLEWNSMEWKSWNKEIWNAIVWTQTVWNVTIWWEKMKQFKMKQQGMKQYTAKPLWMMECGMEEHGIKAEEMKQYATK